MRRSPSHNYLRALMAHATEATEVYSSNEQSLNRLALLLYSTVVVARSYHSAESILVHVHDAVVGPPTNPFLDPKDDPYNPLKYIPSNTLTAIAFGKSRPLKV
jgi:hypothetical protein